MLIITCEFQEYAKKLLNYWWLGIGSIYLGRTHLILLLFFLQTSTTMVSREQQLPVFPYKVTLLLAVIPCAWDPCHRERRGERDPWSSEDVAPFTS